MDVAGFAILFLAVGGASGAAEGDQHWAFHRPEKPEVPEVGRAPWARNPVDRFVLARLNKKGLAPSPEADRRTLLRRLSYDLTGLPPAPEEIDAFVTDEDYERAVDRLLASPRYGERWGRHWLDAARYADTKGYVYAGREESRFVHAWAYRDWVVHALNEDVPYDRFLLLQLAADQAANDRRDLAAMGFLTVGRRFINNPHDIIDDRIDTLGRAMLGLTVACARCHEHKYDPIPTEDYYSLYGVFAGSTERLVPLADSSGDAAYEKELGKRRAAYEKKYRERVGQLLDLLRTQTPRYLNAVPAVRDIPTEEFYQILGADDLKPFIVRRWHAFVLRSGEQDPIFGPWQAYRTGGGKKLASRLRADPLNPRVAAAFADPPVSMDEVAARYGKLFVEIHERWKKEGEGRDAFADPADEALRRILYGPESPIAAPLGAYSEVEWFFEEKVRVELGKLNREMERWIINSRASPPHASILEDHPVQHVPRVFLRGNPATQGPAVPRQFLGCLSDPDRKPFALGSGRLELARAIASKDNPLTARVWVNRVWMHHFGEGIVTTPSDFGKRSGKPSHPDLLDWLAVRFMEEAWSTKWLHRILVTSATYRQSAADRPNARAVDPGNRLLWRRDRRRLGFEAMRDSLLAASGSLDSAVGGKPVRLTKAPTSRRRTLYGFVDRLNLPGIFRTFDFASPDAHSAKRLTTTVPQQALFLMNSAFVTDRARALAARLDVAGARDPEERVRILYRLVFGRAPAARERKIALRVARGRAIEPPKPTPWRYGTGEFDPRKGRMKSFSPLPYFSGEAWQGGPKVPDPKLGWAYLTAGGGHTGNDLAHATVRRWIAPRDGVGEVNATLVHRHKPGDGIRARIVSSRQGELAVWTLHRMEAATNLKGLEIRKGDTLDFVVDIRNNLNSDEFEWAPVIRMADGGRWDAAEQFRGTQANQLGPWERLAQVLLLSNEFAYVD